MSVRLDPEGFETVALLDSIEDNVARRIDELMSNIERDKEIIIREVIKIARLRPLYDKE